MGGCIQCRKQKEQSTKNFSIGDTFSWLDSDCSMDDYNNFQIFDEEIKLEIQQKFYPQKKEKDNQQQEQIQLKIQQQESDNQNYQEDVLNVQSKQFEEDQFQNQNEDENEHNFINQETKVEQILQNNAQIIQSNYKTQQKLRIKSRKQSFQEMKNEKLSEKNEKQIKRSRSIGKYNNLLPFNQILYQIFVSSNQQTQQKIVQENEVQELKTKINSIQQQQKRLSSSDSIEDDDFIPNKPMVFNSNLIQTKNKKNQKDQEISIKQQNENLIIEDDNNDSDCNEMEYQCFCCQKSFQSIFQLNCLHQYNQRCLINQILNQINNQEKIISCLCQKQINNQIIEQVKYFNNITQVEQEKITQFLQNFN